MSRTNLPQREDSSISHLVPFLRISQSSVTPRRIGQKTPCFWQSPAPSRDCLVSSPNHIAERRQICFAPIVDVCKQVFKTLFRRSKTYRYRRFQFCKARFRTQEKTVRWEGVDRKWPGTAPSEKDRAVDECLPYAGSAKWNRVGWISSKMDGSGMWITLCPQGLFGD